MSETEIPEWVDNPIDRQKVLALLREKGPANLESLAAQRYRRPEDLKLLLEDMIKAGAVLFDGERYLARQDTLPSSVESALSMARRRHRRFITIRDPFLFGEGALDTLYDLGWQLVSTQGPDGLSYIFRNRELT